jgi:Cu2+-exporting ATPase/Cu+-exporting ATPase
LASSDIVFELEKHSRHLIGRELTLKAQEMGAEEGNVRIDNIQEVWGKGMTGDYKGHRLEMKALNENDEAAFEEESDVNVYNNVGLFVDGDLTAAFQLADELRDDAVDTIQSMKKMGVQSFIISGDKQREVKKVANTLTIPDSNTFAEVSPDGKFDILDKYENPIMVGDGANDALALKSSYVGIATHGSVEISMQAADAYMTTAGVYRIFVLMQIAKETYKLIYRNLIFSLIYNLIAAALAITGIITPLWSAVIMPISSITVIVSTLVGTKKMHQLQKNV